MVPEKKPLHRTGATYYEPTWSSEGKCIIDGGHLAVFSLCFPPERKKLHHLVADDAALLADE